MNAYFRSREGVVDGPFFEGQLIGMWDGGQMVDGDLLCLQGDEKWQPVEVIMGWVVAQAAEVEEGEQEVIAFKSAPVVVKEKKKTGFVAGCFGLVILMFVGLIVLGMINNAFRSPDEVAADAEQSERRLKYYKARRLVEAGVPGVFLVAPKSAEFSRRNGAVAEAWPQGKNAWRANGLVDSQNVFGAMLRVEWEIIWSENSGDVLYLSIGEQESSDLGEVIRALGK